MSRMPSVAEHLCNPDLVEFDGRAAHFAFLRSYAVNGLLVPLLERRDRLRGDSLFWYSPSHTLMYGKTPSSWIRRGDWKLIHWYGDYLDGAGFTPDQVPYGKLVLGARTELYNVKSGIGE